MAYVSPTEIQDIVDWIEFQAEDASFLTPLGVTMYQVVADNAPLMLDYINMSLANKYALQSSPLNSSVMTILKWATWAEVQYFAYRRSIIEEKKWGDEWMERVDSILNDIVNGKKSLGVPEQKTNASPSMWSEPRQFTITDDKSLFDNTYIDSVFD